MTVSIVVAIVLGWMLANLWLTTILLMMCDATLEGWKDMFWLLLSSIFTPVATYLCGWMVETWKERKK